MDVVVVEPERRRGPEATIVTIVVQSLLFHDYP